MNQNRLRELFHYDHDTGNLIRRVSKGGAPAGSVAGSPFGRGYLQVRVDGGRYLAHRLVWLYVHGCWPEDQIDHINGNKADNRISNLRQVNNSENQQNLRGAPISNKCGLLGVSWHTVCSKWRAQIKINGKKKHLGHFDSAEEAHAAYLEAKSRLHPFQTIVQDETAKGNGGG